MVCTRRGCRSYLRSNRVQLPTLLINPPPRRSAARGPSSLASILNPIVVRLSARDTCEGYPLPVAYYILHYRRRSSESRSVYIRAEIIPRRSTPLLRFASRKQRQLAQALLFSERCYVNRGGKNCYKINDFTYVDL